KEQQYTSYVELSAIYNKRSYLRSPSRSLLYVDSAMMSLKDKNGLSYYNLLKLKAFLFLSSEKYDSSLHYAMITLPYADSVGFFPLQNTIYQLVSQSYFGLKDSLKGYKYRIKTLEIRLSEEKKQYKTDLLK